MSSQVPLYSLSAPSQYPVIGLVGGDGNPEDLSGFIPDSVFEPYDPDRLTSGEATISRLSISSGAIPTTSGSLRLAFFTARKSETITQLRLISGTTAASATPTLVRAGVFSVAENGDIALAASIANDTTIFAAANTVYTRSLTASFNKVAGTRYAVGILVVSGVGGPTFIGSLRQVAAEMGMAPRLAGSVSGQTDLPASVAAGSIADISTSLYAVLVP